MMSGIIIHNGIEHINGPVKDTVYKSILFSPHYYTKRKTTF